MDPRTRVLGEQPKFTELAPLSRLNGNSEGVVNCCSYSFRGKRGPPYAYREALFY